MGALSYTGKRATGMANPIHTGRGRLLGYLISHDQVTAQVVTFYDSLSAAGTVLLRVNVAPEQCPVFVRFGIPPGRDEGIEFATGLSICAGNCEVSLWSVNY
jgi:hypothetical protein